MEVIHIEMSNLRYLYETTMNELLQKHLSHFLIGVIFFKPILSSDKAY